MGLAVVPGLNELDKIIRQKGSNSYSLTEGRLVGFDPDLAMGPSWR